MSVYGNLYDYNKEIVNEGAIKQYIINKLKEYYKEKETKKKQKDKDKTDIQNRGYTDSQYNFAYDLLKEWIELYKQGIGALMGDADMYGMAFYYLNIKESEFHNWANKTLNNIELDYCELAEYMINDQPGCLTENDPEYKLFSKVKYIEVYDDGGGDHLLYFPSKRIFAQWYHEENPQFEMKNAMKFADLIACGKSCFEKSNSDIHNQYIEAYIAADKALGIYRLSEKPKN